MTTMNRVVQRAIFLLMALSLATPSFAAPAITREAVVAALNARRVEAGLAPLREDPRLDQAAEDRIRDMEELGYWSHHAPDGRGPFMWLRLRNYAYRAAGENLAAGFDTTDLMVQSWMESDGHRANILSADFEDCGIAIIEGSTKGPASGHSVVVLFGRSVSSDPPPRTQTATAVKPPSEPGRTRVPRR